MTNLFQTGVVISWNSVSVSLMNLTCDFAGIDRPKGTQDETDRLLLLMRTFALGTTLAHSKDDREKVRQQVRDALSAFDKEFLPAFNGAQVFTN